eukprot:3299346-Rhodomonas_salina.1
MDGAAETRVRDRLSARFGKDRVGGVDVCRLVDVVWLLPAPVADKPSISSPRRLANPCETAEKQTPLPRSA